jgi:hypothetical protein
MTKILEQLFAVLRPDLFSQSLLDLCDIKTEIVATSHSAWPLPQNDFLTRSANQTIVASPAGLLSQIRPEWQAKSLIFQCDDVAVDVLKSSL